MWADIAPNIPVPRVPHTTLSPDAVEFQGLNPRENAMFTKRPSAKPIKKDFCIDKETLCPVTYLPITSKPEWINFKADANYTVSFFLIGNAILYSIPSGANSALATRNWIAKREAILKETGLYGKKYAEIRDQGRVPGHLPKEGRVLVTNMVVKEAAEGNLLGCWVCNAPNNVRLMINVGVKLHRPTAPIVASASYEAAVLGALGVLEKQGVNAGTKRLVTAVQKEWNLVTDSCHVQAELIGKDILYVAAHGVMTDDCVEQLIAICHRVLDQTGLTQKGSYYSITNWTDVEKLSWKSRSIYLAGLKALQEKVPCKLAVIFGSPPKMKRILELSKPFIPMPFVETTDLEKAVSIIEKARLARAPAAPPKIPARDQQLKQYADELMSYIGILSWEEKDTLLESVEESHPFRGVFEAINIIKSDLDDLFEKRSVVEESLRDSEMKYRSLVENAQECIFIAQDWRMVFLNHVVIETLGYTEQELLLMPLADIIHPLDRQMVFDRHTKRTDGESVNSTYPLRFVTKNGTVRWGDLNATLITWEGKPAILNFLNDITDRKRAEGALIESERRLREAQSMGGIGNWEINPDTDQVTFSSEMCKLLERDPAIGPEFLWDSLEFFFMDTVTSVKERVQNAIDTGEGWVHDVRITLPSGREVWYHDIGNTVKDATGKVTRICGVTQDITRRKQMELSLQHSEERYRTLVKHASEMALQADDQGKLIFVNPATIRITGFDEDELIGRDYFSFICPSMREKVVRFFGIQFVKRTPNTYLEYPLITKSGQNVWFGQNTQLLEKSDKSLFFQAVARDITERKQAEIEADLQIKIQKMVMEIALTYISLPLDKVDEAIHASLRDVCGFVGADRGYLFEYNLKDKIAINTHEWHEGSATTAKKHQRQSVPLSLLVDLVEDHWRGITVHIPDTAEVSEQKKILHSILERQGIKSLFAVPLMDGSNCLGYAGFDSLRHPHCYTEAEQRLLAVFAHMMVNVRKRRDIEMALQESEKKFKRLADRTHDMILEINTEGVKTYVSPSHKAVLGFEPADVLNGTIFEYIHPDDLWEVQEAFSHSIETHSTAFLIYRHRTVDGNYLWLESYGSPLFDNDQALIGGVIVSRDITERKMAEERLSNQMAFIGTLLDTIPSPVFYKDRAGKYLGCNRAFEGITGKTREEVVGKCVDELYPAEIAAMYKEKDRELYEQAGTQIYDGKFRAADGQIKDVIINKATFLDTKNHISGVVGVFTDITERKQAETELTLYRQHLEDVVRERTAGLQKETEDHRQAKEALFLAKEAAEAANKAKSTFLASMSHELRTPLQAILGFSDVLEKQFYGPLGEKQAKHVLNIASSGQHLLALVNDVLDLSKIEAGKMDLSYDFVPLREFITEALTVIEEKVRQQSITVNLEIDDDTATRSILADARLLKQVLYNLLSNASKFTPYGGQIAVGVRIMTKAEERRASDKKTIEIYVTDTGRGLSVKDQERVFEEFYQVYTPGMGKNSGSGLGLSLSRKIIEMHGGHLWAESAGRGLGSSFIINLPCSPANFAC